MQLANLPDWVAIPLTVGGSLLTTFAGQLPDQVQLWGFYLGIALTAIGLVGGHYIFASTLRQNLPPEPT